MFAHSMKNRLDFHMDGANGVSVVAVDDGGDDDEDDVDVNVNAGADVGVDADDLNESGCDGGHDLDEPARYFRQLTKLLMMNTMSLLKVLPVKY